MPKRLKALWQPRRFKVLHGGRGGAKSHSVAQALLVMGMQRKLRILCCREIQKSLAESSMQVLADYIGRLGLGSYYTVQKTGIFGTNGTSFAFTGLQDHTADSVKSYEGVDITWLEEAQNISDNSFNILIPTIRKPGSEIWATFNPTHEDDYVYQRFVLGTDPDALVIEINWRDNPWFSAEMDTERLKLKALNDDLYQHVWEGKCQSIAGFLFKREWMLPYDIKPANLNTYISADFAVTGDGGDFTEILVWGVDPKGTIYALDWWGGQQTSDVWVSALVDKIERWRPERFIGETGQIRRAVEPMLIHTMRVRKATVVCEWLAHTGNKAAHASPIMGLMATGMVLWPRTEWATRIINQLCAFTGEDGRIDDAVDACSLMGRYIHRMWGAIVPTPEPVVDLMQLPTMGQMMQPIQPRDD